MSPLSRWGVRAATAALVAAPSVAAACPSCAGRDGAGYSTFAAMAAMILLPFGIALVVWRIIKRLDTSSDADRASKQT